jgi:aminoglycoside phosphotransferase (APT) family kinase protein
MFECVVADRSEALVLQVGPAGEGLFRDYDLAAMATIQRCLGDCPDVPVARVRWLELDPAPLGAPFYVMERAPGQVPSDNPSYHAQGWFATLPAARQAAAWEAGIAALVALHRLDASAPRFAFLARAPWGMAPGADPAQCRLAQWRDFLAWGSREPLPAIEAALAALARTAPPPPARLAVSWGDAKISNCVIDHGRVTALLDWELCGLSDPAEDLAHWLVLDWAQWRAPGLARLPGLPSPQATVACYEALAGRTVPHVEWWFRFGLVRLAIIYHRFLERRRELGRLAPDADPAALNPITALLPEAFARGGLP